MEQHNLNDFIKGWFIGDFKPTLLNTTDFEVAIKRYKAGDSEATHHHKVATEYTIIITGEVLMNNIKFKANDIIVLQPSEASDFQCLTDVVTVVVKTPSVKGDKYE
jgi:hypothetical protein